MRFLEGGTRHCDGQCKSDLALDPDSDESLIHRHVDRLQALAVGLSRDNVYTPFLCALCVWKLYRVYLHTCIYTCRLLCRACSRW